MDGPAGQGCNQLGGGGTSGQQVGMLACGRKTSLAPSGTLRSAGIGSEKPPSIAKARAAPAPVTVAFQDVRRSQEVGDEERSPGRS